MSTYIRSQLDPLFDAVTELEQSSFAIDSDTGIDGDTELVAVDRTTLERVSREARLLRDLKQTLRLGIHRHKHGDSHYLFLLPEGVEMNEADLALNLQEDFEPEHGETLDVERIDSPDIFDGREPAQH